MLIEHRGRVVHLRATILALVCNKPLDRGAHPSGFLRAVGLELSNPPVFVSILVVAELIYRFLWPMTFVLEIGGKTDLQ